MNEYTNILKCELLRENEDGSAVYTFEFNEQEKEALLRYGIMAAIKAGIEEAKMYHPDYNWKDAE